MVHNPSSPSSRLLIARRGEVRSSCRWGRRRLRGKLRGVDGVRRPWCGNCAAETGPRGSADSTGSLTILTGVKSTKGTAKRLPLHLGSWRTKERGMTRPTLTSTFDLLSHNHPFSPWTTRRFLDPLPTRGYVCIHSSLYISYFGYHLKLKTGRAKADHGYQIIHAVSSSCLLTLRHLSFLVIIHRGVSTILYHRAPPLSTSCQVLVVSLLAVAVCSPRSTGESGHSHLVDRLIPVCHSGLGAVGVWMHPLQWHTLIPVCSFSDSSSMSRQ